MKSTMKWSLSLGKVSGISIYIHWTFIILLVWVYFLYSGNDQAPFDGITGVLFVIALFGCVTLHELGHALTAQRYNIVTRDIVLLPIGGMARMEKMPEKPFQELMVALAGPAVNVLIAIVIFIVLSATNNFPDPDVISEESQKIGFIPALMSVNILLAVFNMIPAFPMDGGRVLRALLSYKVPRLKATKIAASIGQALAIAFIFFGFFSNFWLIFIGIFIFLGAGGEATSESTRASLSDHKVSDVLMKQFTLLAPTDTIQRAIDVLLNTQEKEFLIGEGDRVDGVLTRDDIIKGLSSQGKDAPVTAVMNEEFRTLHSEDKLLDLFRELSGSKSSMFPVKENDQLIGIVNLENIQEFIMLNQASEEHS